MNHAMTKDSMRNIDFDILADWLPVGIFEVDANGKCQYANRALCVILFGVEYYLFAQDKKDDTTQQAQHEDANQCWLDWLDPDAATTISPRWDTLVQSTKTLQCECRLHPQLNSATWVQVHLYAMSNDQGTRYFGTLEDISARKALEQEVSESHKENEEHLEAISAILISVDHQGRIQRWNTVAEATFGRAAREMKGKVLGECSLAWDGESLEQVVDQCMKSKVSQHVEDVAFLDQTGKEGYLGLTLNPIFSKMVDGEVKGVLILGKDLTEQKFMKVQLLQAQKMESIGQLAAGIAHEINTPVQFISDNVQFLKQSFGEVQAIVDTSYRLLKDMERDVSVGPKVSKGLQSFLETDIEFLKKEIPSAIEQTIEGITRVATIVQAMKVFSHPGVEGLSTINLNDNIANTVTVSRNEWRYVAEVTVELVQNLPLITCNASEINQVMLNLIVNAAQAIEEKKKMTPDLQGQIHISTRLDDEEWIDIKVTDNGGGIPDDHKNRIFDPFFTTKEVGKGTGQGLAIAHSIIRSHGGAISFESTVGEGTTFLIQLPIKVEVHG